MKFTVQYDSLINWLLKGDAAIQYQTLRFLLDDNMRAAAMQKYIATEGWGKKLMEYRRPDGHWGHGYYYPKWACTHYTLLELRNLYYPPADTQVQQSTMLILDAPQGAGGGINYSGTQTKSDVCINGMVLYFASYFIKQHPRLDSLVDYLLDVQMADGGWNCNHHKGDTHSSLHTTLSVLEGLAEYKTAGNTYRLEEINAAEEKGREFILIHRLFKSHRTGNNIHPSLQMLSYPARWKYDILRCLDYFVLNGLPYDERMQDAIDVLLKKQRKDGTWPLQNKHPGKVFFDMEKTGGPSRWNTLRVLRLLKHFKLQSY